MSMSKEATMTKVKRGDKGSIGTERYSGCAARSAIRLPGKRGMDSCGELLEAVLVAGAGFVTIPQD
jgi:hypothetical protein